MTTEERITELQARLVKLEALVGSPKDYPASPDLTSQMKMIMVHVCTHYGITVERILSDCRAQQFVWPRWIAMFLCHSTTGATLTHIGQIFRRDHGAVSNAIRGIENRRSLDRKFDAEICEWIAALQPSTPDTQHSSTL